MVTHLPLTAQPLVLGTGNRKKGQELADLLGPAGVAIQTLADFPNALQVREDGNSFAANARPKATVQARHLGRWVLGEDSGLAVAALGGAPGIFSARYAGPEATDQDNIDRLLTELDRARAADRSAQFVCHMTIADPAGTVRAESEAACQGRICRSPAGAAGFGYDPVFEIIEYHRTFAQLGPRVKQLLSHRSRALQRLLPQLIRLVRNR